MTAAKPWLLAAWSGLLLVLIHPDANLYVLAPFALTPLYLVVCGESNWRRRFFLGWLSGILYWGGMCYWIQGTLARHGGMSFALATFVFVLFALAKGLHSAVFTALGPRHPLAFAALWAGLERTHSTFGFPWLTLGDAGLDSALRLLSPLLGVYSLSFVFALLAAWFGQRKWIPALALLVFLLPPAGESGPGTDLALSIQPNFDEERPPRDPAAALIALSQQGQRPNLILWPEMPAGLYYEQDTLLRARLAQLVRERQAPLVAGTVSFVSLHEPRNSAQFVDARGEPAGRYDKVNLVPFGEFVPWPFNTFVDKVSTEAGVFTPGDRVVVRAFGDLRIGAFICYESAFPHYVRQFTAQGANVLVNLSNDGYFARSAARGQHLALARMRAAENRRYVLRSTNDGYTVAIDEAGALRTQAPAFEPRAIPLEFRRENGLTPYVRYGDWFAWSCLIAALASTARARYRPRAVRA